MPQDDNQSALTSLAMQPSTQLVTLASVALLRRDGAALFQHRDEKPGLSCSGAWVFPGGHSEPSEPIAASAAREFREETGYICDDLRFLGNYTIAVGAERFSAAVFFGVYDEIQKIECFEGQAMEFIRRGDGLRYGVSSSFLLLWEKALVAAGLATVVSS